MDSEMTGRVRPPRGTKLVWLTFLTYYAIVSFGFAIVITGATLPHVQRALSLNDSQTGLLTAMWSLGFLLFAAVAGSLADRVDNKRLLAAGAILISTSLSLFGRHPSLAANVFLQFALGGGVGIYEGTLNALTVRLYPSAQATALNVLHAMIGVGTMSGPILASRIVEAGHDFRTAFLVVGAFSALLLPLLVPTRFPGPLVRGASAGSAVGGVARVLALAKNPPFALLCAAMAFYVGVEFGTTVWITKYLAEVKGLPHASASRILSLFWAGLLAGRLLVGLGVRFVGSRTLAVVLPVLSLVALAAGLRSSSPAALHATFVLFGLSMSGIFPIFLAIAGEDHPELAGAAMGVIVSIGFAGAFVVPWAIALSFAPLGMGRAMHLYLLDIALMIAAAALYAATSARARRGRPGVS